MTEDEIYAYDDPIEGKARYEGEPMAAAWPTPSVTLDESGVIGIIITDYGANAIAKAANTGTKVDLTHMAVGDGGGELYRPDPGQQKLRNELWRGEIKRYEIYEFDPTQLIVVAVIPAEVGTFWIREVGIFDSTGGLVAVGNFPETMKVRDKTGAIQTMELRTHIQFSNAVLDHVHITVRRDGIDEAHEEIHRLIRHLKHDVWKVSKAMIQELTEREWTDPAPEPPCDSCCELVEVTSEQIREMFDDD